MALIIRHTLEIYYNINNVYDGELEEFVESIRLNCRFR